MQVTECTDTNNNKQTLADKPAAAVGTTDDELSPGRQATVLDGPKIADEADDSDKDERQPSSTVEAGAVMKTKPLDTNRDKQHQDEAAGHESKIDTQYHKPVTTTIEKKKRRGRKVARPKGSSG